MQIGRLHNQGKFRAVTAILFDSLHEVW